MDGSQRKVLVSQDLSWPVSLAYDFLDSRVYWADEKLRCIGSASLEGEDIKVGGDIFLVCLANHSVINKKFEAFKEDLLRRITN